MRTKAVLAVVAIWLVAALVIFLARSSQPTPESVAAYIGKHPLAGKSTGERDAILNRVAKGLNRLDFDQRQQLRRDRVTERFYGSLTPAEQEKFMDLTLPAGFKQMMEALNKMTPERRRKIVDRSLERMRNEQPPESDRLKDDQVKKIIDAGLRSFYNDASAQVKLDLAPLIEQMQKSLQGGM